MFRAIGLVGKARWPCGASSGLSIPVGDRKSDISPARIL